jgi:hypothetical protein
MLRKIGRLFTIRTRFEAWVVIYAIALGAVERGQHYLATYPGSSGWMLALACTGVVFLAGAKLLDSVRKPETVPASGAALYHSLGRRPMARRSRPTVRPPSRFSGSRISRHRG